MDPPRLKCARGGNKRLSNHLATEYALPSRLRAAAAKQVHLQLLELEQLQKIRQALIHERAGGLLQPNLNVPCMSALWPGNVHRYWYCVPAFRVDAGNVTLVVSPPPMVLVCASTRLSPGAT